MSSHSMSRPDPMSELIGTEFGIKGVVELWLNVGENGWTSLDMSYSTAHDMAAVRWRAGWRPIPSISIGPELRYDDNAEGSASRAGLFIRYQWAGGEISAAGGVAGQLYDQGDDDDLIPYTTLNLLYQF